MSGNSSRSMNVSVQIEQFAAAGTGFCLTSKSYSVRLIIPVCLCVSLYVRVCVCLCVVSLIAAVPAEVSMRAQSDLGLVLQIVTQPLLNATATPREEQVCDSRT